MQSHFPLHFLLFFYSRLVQQSAWSSQGELEQAAEPLPVEFSEELPLMENAVDMTHLKPQPTNSSNSSSEEDEEENEQHGSSLVSKHSSELLQDDSCLAEQHLSTLEGNWPKEVHIFPSLGNVLIDRVGQVTLQLKLQLQASCNIK